MISTACNDGIMGLQTLLAPAADSSANTTHEWNEPKKPLPLYPELTGKRSLPSIDVIWLNRFSVIRNRYNTDVKYGHAQPPSN